MGHIAQQERAVQLGEAEFHSTLGDLYSPWRGARELLLHGRDPYSPEVTRDIQIEYYGKALDQSPGGQRDQQRFVYPVYVAFLLAPSAKFSFAPVRAVSRWILLAITLVSILLWLPLVRGRLSVLSFLAPAVLTISSIPVIQALNLQQLGLLVAGLLAGCAALLLRRHYVWAGMMLAVASIKPQMSAVISLWLILWAVSEWSKRKAFLLGFATMMLALVLAGEWLLAGWISKFACGTLAYAQYTDSGSWLALWLPRPLGLIGTVVLGVGAVLAYWHTRREDPDSPGFAFTFALMLTITILIVPATKPVFNQILVLPALLLAWHGRRAVWARGQLCRALLILWWAIVAAPWVLAAMVVLVWLLLPVDAVERVWRLPLYMSLLPPLAGLGLLVLMRKDAVKRSPIRGT